jgi:stearoyl-CoA desaturase (delta-9 desaturase)
MVGWAYDLKTVSQELLQKRVLRTGDGSHFYNKQENNNITGSDKAEDNLWGWGDEDMREEDKVAAEITKKLI